MFLHRLVGGDAGFARLQRGQNLFGIVADAGNDPQTGYDDTAQTIKQTVRVNYLKKGRLIKSTTLTRHLKKYPDAEKTFLTFIEPADVAGVSFLNIRYPGTEKDEDQWLYLPALKRVRRISASAKNTYFMGTEFSYEDMAGSTKAEDDTHELIGSAAINGRDCYKMRCVPKDQNSMYSKKINYVDKEKLIQQKVEYYDKDGAMLKTLTLLEWGKSDNIWVIKKNEMNNVQKDRSTIIEILDHAYNVPIDDDLFTQRMLKKGVWK